jgi:DNA-binding transcriptional LysR family regulator
VLPAVINTFSREWPGVFFEVDTFAGSASAAKLRDRSIDLVIAREGPALDALSRSGEFEIRRIFEDRLCVVASAGSPWAGLRRNVLAGLAKAPWIVLPYGWGEEVIPNAFQASGLPPPRIVLKTFSMHLRLHLLASDRFVSALPASVLRLHAQRFNLKELPVKLPRHPYAVAIVTLKNRTLSPLVDQFIQSAMQELENQ